MEVHHFDAELWQWRHEDGPGSWFFVTLPEDVSDHVDLEAGPRKGFGSVRVEVVIGSTTWRTSLFPSAGEGAFILPVKKPVRTAEGLDEGDLCSVAVRVLES